MKGRKPRPEALKLIEGERPDRLNPAAPRPSQALPEAPAHLDQVAREEWDRIVPELAELGVLSRTDGAALALYCTVYSRYRDACRKIQSHGMAEETASGGWKGSPYVAVAEKCETMLAKLLAEFGATPSARGRVKVASSEGPKDELSEFLSKRKKSS